MKTLSRNSDNDIYLAGGKIAVVSDIDAQRTIIETILETQRGELQFDDEAGIDYFGTVLQSPRYIDLWAAQVRRKIEDLDFVGAVDHFEYRFDAPSSTLFWTMVVINTDGKTITMSDESLSITGSPGIDVKWDDIYAKPMDIMDTADMVNEMTEAVDTLGGMGAALKPESTLRDVKNLFNAIVFESVNKTYSVKKDTVFRFDGVPVGTVIDLENVYIESSTPWTVAFNDGRKLRFGQDSHRIVLDKKVNPDSSEEDIYTYTFTKRGTNTMTIHGDITEIRCAYANDDESLYPVFRRATGRPFEYLAAISVGELVPLSTIGDNTFRGFANLNSIKWSDEANEVTFGANAFRGCASLYDLSWTPTALTTVGSGCFAECTSLVSLNGLPEAVTVIPAECFKGCESLLTIDKLHAGITSIGASSFADCTSLENINGLPQNITTLEEATFKGCSNLTSLLYWPAGFQELKVSCFEGCSSLRSVYVPESVSAIGDKAFDDCAALTNVLTEGATPPTIGADTFTTDGLRMYVPPLSLEAYQNDSLWNNESRNFVMHKFAVMKFTMSGELRQGGETLASGTSALTSESIWSIDYGDGTRTERFEYLTNGLPAHTYAAVAGAEDFVVTMKGYITEMGATSETAYPFFSIPDSEEFAYLKEIDIKDSPLALIGDYCFAKCTGLSQIGLWADGDDEDFHPYTLGVRAFYGCTSLAMIDWLVDGLGTVIDEDGNRTLLEVPPMGEGCFAETGVTDLRHPNVVIERFSESCFNGAQLLSLNHIGTTQHQVKELEAYCFANCTNLVNINALSNEENLTTLPEGCFYGCGEAVVNDDGVATGAYTGLETIEGINNIATIGDRCFENCVALQSIAPLAESTVDSLPNYCFAGCSSLTRLEGLDNIYTLGSYCFYGCDGLKYLHGLLESQILSIPEGCFQDCVLLKSLVGTRNIKSFGTKAFSGCTGLVTTSGVGESLALVETGAFAGCTGLQCVIMVAKSVPTADTDAFSGVAVSSLDLYVMEGMESAYGAAPVWNSFGRITARTIKLYLEDIPSNLTISGNTGNVDVGEYGYMWYVDFGDGTPVEIYYRDEDDSIATLLPYHTYERNGDYCITLYGDIVGISGGYEPDPDNGVSTALPFLCYYADETTRKLDNLYAVQISTTYMNDIGDYAFCYCDSIRELSISLSPSGFTIGTSAFLGCNSITSIGGDPAQSAVITIGNYAFHECHYLDGSTRFAGVSDLGNYAFYGCSQMADLSGFSGVINIGEHCFENCTNLQNTTGLEAIVTIGDSAFSGCSNMRTINGLSGDLKYLGDHVFSGCPIEKAYVPVEYPPAIQEHTFDTNDSGKISATLYVPILSLDWYQTQKPNLPSPVINDSPWWDGDRVNYWANFSSVTARTITFRMTVAQGTRLLANQTVIEADGSWTISYGSGEQSYTYAGTRVLGSYTFKSRGNKSIMISGAVTGIRAYSDTQYPVFTDYPKNNTLLKEIESSGDMSITSLGELTLKGCGNLTSIKNLPSVVEIGDQCFSGCMKLSDISGLSHVETVGAEAFRGCEALTGIDGLGLNVKSIGDYAFSECIGLTEVQMLASVPPTLGTDVFNMVNIGGTATESPIIPLYVLPGLVDTYKNNTYWSAFQTIETRYLEFALEDVITVDGNDNRILGGKNMVVSDTFWAILWDDLVGTPPEGHTKHDTDLPEHEITSNSLKIRICGRIKSLASDAAETPFLNVQTNEENNFKVIKGFTATENSSLETIGDYSFYECESLATFSAKMVTTLGNYSFYGCSSLTRVSGFGGVTNIGNYVFAESGLTSINGFNSRLAEIGNYAFKDCTIDSIQVYATTPPNITPNTFTGMKDAQDQVVGSFVDGYVYTGSLMVYVPESSIVSYKGSLWGHFGNNGENIKSRYIRFYLKGVPAKATIVANMSAIYSTSDVTVSITNSAGSVVHSDTLDNKSDLKTLPTYTFENRGDYTVTISGNIYEIGRRSGADAEGCFLYMTGTESETTIGLRLISAVEVPSGMASFTRIGNYAFYQCNLLEGILGCDSVQEIGSYAFARCSELSSLGDLNHVTEVDDYAFAECTSLERLDGLGRVTYLGTGAFSGCIELISTAGLGRLLFVDFAESSDKDELWNLDTSFGRNCFYGCEKLTNIQMSYLKPPSITPNTFPSELRRKARAFVPSVEYNNEKPIDRYKADPYWRDYFGPNGFGIPAYIYITIKDVEAGDTIEPDLSGYVNANGPWIVEWGNLNENISSVWDTSIPRFTYGERYDSVTIALQGDIEIIRGSWGDNEYYPLLMGRKSNGTGAIWYPSVTEVAVSAGSSLNKIGDGCFYKYTGLSKINVDGANITEIGAQAFYGCASLATAMIFQNSLTTIGAQAFAGCPMLSTDIDLATSVLTSIGANAFSGCTSITKVKLPSSCISIGASAFSSLSNNGTEFPPCTGLQTFSWAKSDMEPPNIGATCFKGCTSLSVIEEFSNVSSIPAYTFAGCTSLRTIAFAEDNNVNITSIGDGAFLKTGIVSLTLPSTITSIGKYAFAGCGSLTQVTMNANAAACLMGEFCFAECTSLTTVANFPAVRSDGAEVSIPQGLFLGCKNLSWSSFISIVSRSNATAFGPYCFAKCYTLNGVVNYSDQITRYGEGCFNCTEELKVDFGEEGYTPSFKPLFGNQNSILADIDNEATDTGDKWATREEKLWDGNASKGISGIVLPELNGINVDTGAYLGDGCFMNCTNLSTGNSDWGFIKRLNQIPAFTFYNCCNISTDNTFNFYPHATTEAPMLSECCLAHTNIMAFPNEQWAIETTDFGKAYGCFLGCTGLTSLSGFKKLFAGGSVTDIPEACFYGCSGLINLAGTGNGDLADVTSIGEYAFAYCTSLTAFNGLDKVNNYPVGCFCGCASMNSITQLANPSTANELQLFDKAFAECPSITEIDLSAYEGQNQYVTVWTIEDGNLAQSAQTVDPFPNLPTVRDIKGNLRKFASVLVSYTLYTKYFNQYGYWSQFFVNNPVPENQAPIEILMTIPASGGTLTGAGALKFDPDSALPKYIAWGDSQTVAITANEVSLDSSQFTHEYASGLGTVTLKIFGAVTEISGKIITDANNTEIPIPIFYTNHTQTSYSNTWVTGIIISGDTIETIGNGCFHQCSNLSSISSYSDTPGVLPPNITSLGKHAFRMTIIQNIDWMPTTITSIGNRCFYAVNTLSDITRLKDTGVTTIPSYCFAYCGQNRQLSLDGIQKITNFGGSCFLAASISGFKSDGGISYFNSNGITLQAYCFRQTPIETLDGLPSSTTYTGAGGGQFSRTNIRTLEGFHLVSTASTIPKACFTECPNLVSLAGMPNGIISLGAAAFKDCTNLSDLDGKLAQITSMGENCFSGCSISTLDSSTFNTGLTSIPSGCFANCTILTTLEIPNTVTTIGADSFNGCSGLSSLTLSQSLTSLPDGCFADCESLANLSIPNAVTAIGKRSFAGCEALTELNTNEVTTIGTDCFNGCSGLTTLTLGLKLTSIPSGCFVGCQAITQITANRWVDNSITTITDTSDRPAFEYDTLNDNPNLSIKVPYDADGNALVAYKANWGQGDDHSYRFDETKITQSPST